MIKSGTLRTKFNEALTDGILCRNMLLMTLASMRKSGEYIAEQDHVQTYLMNRGYSERYIDNIVNQIDDNHHPIGKQIQEVLDVIGTDHKYIEGYLDNGFLKSVDKKELRSEDGRALKYRVYATEQVEKILEAIGYDDIRLNSAGTYWHFCNKDGDNPYGIIVYNEPHLVVVNNTRGKFFDNKKEDIITLVQFALNCGYKESLAFIRNVLSNTVKVSKTDSLKLTKTVKQKERDEEKILDEGIFKHLEPVLHQLWKDEGISEEARETFEICYYPLKQQIYIPYRRWSDGALVGFNRRETLNHIEVLFSRKYTMLQGSNRSGNIYGYYQNQKEIERAGYCTIFEAEKSVLKRFSNGDCTAVATMGKNITVKQIEILKTLDVAEFVLAYDADVDINEIYKICESFYKDGRKISYICDILGLLGEKDSPADLTDEQYRCLFELRTEYDDAEHEKYLASLT